MAKTTSDPRQNPVYQEVKRHYDWASNETDSRRTGRGRIGTISFDEADELFRSWLDDKKWPYDALLVDPRTFTFITEKTSRLIRNKLRGKLIPREGGDVVGARINNELLSYQWDQANHHGSMITKWGLMDINTRKYGASFALCKWRREFDYKKKIVFDGPEMKVLNNRDCLPDPSGNNIESLNWFQVREFVTLQELKHVNDQAKSGPIYRNLEILEAAMSSSAEQNGGGGDTRDIRWQSRNRAISGLSEDPIGRDEVFKTVEIVTEYRRDKWITFSPRHGIVIREIDNPYGNNEIPIVMLRYYMIDDDLYGISEIEPVKGLQKAINALLSQYVDEINQKLYSPIAVNSSVRQKTLRWGKGARWLMNNPLTDFRLVESQSNAASFFNNTYSALVAAMMNAVGESSLGVSNLNRYNPEKTASEVQAIAQQRNARDSYNQVFLAEAIERQMRLWHSMNQSMLFSDPNQKQFILRVVGRETIRFFKEQGLSDTAVPNEAFTALLRSDRLTPEQLQVPTVPVNVGTEDNPELAPKFEMDDSGEFGQLYVEPTDLMGFYDYIADVESMSIAAADPDKQGRNTAMTTILNNQQVTQQLEKEGIRPKFKELFIAWLEDNGFKDANRFFESIPEAPTPPAPNLPGATPPTGQDAPVPQPPTGMTPNQIINQATGANINVRPSQSQPTLAGAGA